MRKKLFSNRVFALLVLGAAIGGNCESGSCGSDGCDTGCESSSGCDGCGMEPLTEPFPAENLIPRAAQIRVAESGLGFIKKNVTDVAATFLGDPESPDKSFAIDIDPTCDQDVVVGKIHVCGKKIAGQCVELIPPCQIRILLTALELILHEPFSVITVLARAIVATPPLRPISIDGVLDCDITVNTLAGSRWDIGVVAQALFVVEPTTGRTVVGITEVDLPDIEDSHDIDIHGGWVCDAADYLKGEIVDLLKDELKGLLDDALKDSLCANCKGGKFCPAGTVCAPDGTCMAGAVCAQNLGLEQKINFGDMGGLGDPGLALSFWAGGHVSMGNNGISLGVLGGMAPGGKPSPCVKPHPELKPTFAEEIQMSDVFKKNQTPDGEPFHIGIGFHKNLLDLGAYAAYESGALCLSVDSSIEPNGLLTTKTLGLLLTMRSVKNLAPEGAAVKLSLVPGKPPVFTLGEGKIKDEGQGKYTIEDPLLTVEFPSLNLDLFVLADDRYVRVLRLTTDVNIPIALVLDANNKVIPVLGDLDDAFSNFKVTETELLEETPESLEAAFPVLFETALSALLPDLLSDGFDLPDLSGIVFENPKFMSLENNTMLGIFSSFAFPAPDTGTPASSGGEWSPQVETKVELLEVVMPRDPEVLTLREKSDLEEGPVAVLHVGGNGFPTQELEYSWRVNNGFWSPFLKGPILRIQSNQFFLVADHKIEVRARVRGRPASTDPWPKAVTVKIENPFPADETPEVLPQGFGCNTSKMGAYRGVVFMLWVILGLFVMRRSRGTWRLDKAIGLPLAL